VAQLQRRYRDVIRHHLGKLLDKLFAEFTGVHFHVAWAPDDLGPWETRSLPTGSPGCCRLVEAGAQSWPGCWTCGPHHLAPALKSDRGHRFTCRLGVRNCWFPVRVRGQLLGIAYLQALEAAAARALARHRSNRASGPSPCGQPGARGRLSRAGAKVLSRSEFGRAARFLRFLVHYVQTSSLADLRKADLTNARRAVLALEKEQARLHKVLQRHLPPAPQAPRRTGAEPHAEQVVRRLLECLDRDYRKPITLQRYASELGMNAAYVSALFSRAVGVPFKTYLTDLRLEKAKELLGNPTTRASDVATAVGYASENRFRIAFKKATGLAPRVWRETIRTNAPQPPS
jgi:AraC-like DNA-binding protein